MKKRIMFEKECTEECAEWMVDRIESLVSYMQYGHALIAYKRQDGAFRLAMGTLILIAITGKEDSKVLAIIL
ncbi:hypothetical protein D0T87_08075 [Bacteroides sp. 51]|nr:hypothetical protein [Bacteroides sp. 51]